MTTAVVVLFVQAAANLGGGVLLLDDIAGREEHGQEVTTQMHLFGWGSVVGALVLAVCAVFLLRRVNVARLPVVVLEGIVIVLGFMNLITGALQAVIGIALGVAVLVCLLSRRTEDWFSPARSG